MTAASRRARAVAKRLPTGPVEGAEVGVFDGRMSSHLLSLRRDLVLHMVDRWDTPTPAYASTGDSRAKLSCGEMRAAMEEATKQTAFAADRRTLCRMDSLDAAQRVAGLDFAFIDADHGFEAVGADIAAWMETLKPGGMLCGHDYGDPRFGVTEAVDAACAAFGWELETGADKTWFVWP